MGVFFIFFLAAFNTVTYSCVTSYNIQVQSRLVGVGGVGVRVGVGGVRLGVGVGVGVGGANL